ncbi:L domain-like protein [Anaeromyces robustus]|uniref:Leucine-rich repeat-containing protein 51 n=1 Tax=Anaeromyces robustus TaxID=1754192 RepID=A0A1Y1XFE7_9FUNG|nr:L domain-like protein [Anaeromyces robustus]|eukprot:ORX84478.1 L domain-like protein [Anaeromyces robustus]
MDYSFKEMIEISEILEEEPRIGKIDILQQKKTNKNNTKTKNDENEVDSENEDKNEKDEKSNQVGWSKKTFTKAPLIIPMVPLSSSYKYHHKDGMTVTEEKEKKTAKYINRAIRLSNNNFLSLEGLDMVCEKIIADPFKNLSWIDLSFNSLEEIHECILKFDNLKTLFLHANKISKVTEIDKLAKLPNLRSLTLHGNPLEEDKNYRFYVILMLPQLINLNFSGISKQERIGSKGCIVNNPHKYDKKKKNY